ncbi:hypothetical protein FNV43_RR08713 [Rhamnella rubrinervis]|uniref:Uncharacterized protein n=1 Tax=Rhamnella rubrinervis TaxID=2594499 RepID=A0A8K0H9S4_9ROSA|nr:hypothetical protein FNV43_RR08713 [Rhamnella rubrinervis]
MPHVEPNAGRDDSDEHRPKFFIQHPVLIKINIPSIFTPEDMPYLKESQVKKANILSTLDGKLDFPRTRLRATKAGKKHTSFSREKVYLIQLARLALEFAQHGLKKGMTFEDISYEAEQCALKLCSKPNIISFSRSVGSDHSCLSAAGLRLPAHPVLSEDEGSGKESSEISFEEDEPKKNDEAKKTPSQTRSEGTGPTTNTREVSPTVQPSQGEPR